MKPSPVVSELQRIAESNDGVLLPEQVVEEARPASSPLHSRFTWDDNEAASNYRLWQARQLIRTTVQYIKVDGAERSVRVFVSLTPDREEDSGGYRSVVNVLSNAGMRTQLLRDALAEMERFEAKYSSLKELVELFKASKKVRQQLG